VRVSISSIGGWYDIFLPGQLRDFGVPQDAGRPARLMVEPWTHISQAGEPVREAIEFGLARAGGEQPPWRARVRLFVVVEEAWRDFDSSPPADYPPNRFHLRPARSLSAEPVVGRRTPAGESAPDRYPYDPGDPTPAVGGVRMGVGRMSGRVANAALEARPDVLTYTTALEADTEVIGEARRRWTDA
jgi:putative CocE/NonD family hydrolase